MRLLIWYLAEFAKLGRKQHKLELCWSSISTGGMKNSLEL